MSGFNLPGQDISKIFESAAKGAVVDGSEDVAIDSKLRNTKKPAPVPPKESPAVKNKPATSKEQPVKESLTSNASKENIVNNVSGVDNADKANNVDKANSADRTNNTDKANNVSTESTNKVVVNTAEDDKEKVSNVAVEKSAEGNSNEADKSSGDNLNDSVLHSIKKDTPLAKDDVDKVIALYTKANECEKENIEFLSALLFKDIYSNINNFVYSAANLSKQDITEAKLLYQLFTIENRVERVFTLLDIPYEKLERLSYSMEVLSDSEVLGDTQKILAKNLESEIAKYVELKGEMFFVNNKQKFTDILISMI